jgi:hypothetical protein
MSQSLDVQTGKSFSYPLATSSWDHLEIEAIQKEINKVKKEEKLL